MMYVIPLLYRVSSLNSHISITRLHRVLQSVIMKRTILHTALNLDSNGTSTFYRTMIRFNLLHRIA